MFQIGTRGSKLATTQAGHVRDWLIDAGFDSQLHIVTTAGDVNMAPVERIGVGVFTQALREALGDKRGIRRYGAFHLAMDDTLVRAALDLSGRPFLVWNLPFPAEKIGSFDTELVREFFQALSTHGGITLHVDLLHGLNAHHIAEAAFKAVARALREAVEPDPRMEGRLPSTKGAL